MKLMQVIVRWSYFLPVVIFFLALYIRLIYLADVPYGFHSDEVVNTYIGRFILLNGKDIYGNVFPLLYFNKFGDFPPVIPMYLSGLATLLFGVNVFAARFASAFIGSLLVFPLFALFKTIASRKFALIASVCLALFPWHIVLSRSSSEGVIALTVFVTGIAFVAKGIQQKSNKLLFVSWLFLGLTYLLYPSFRLLTPLLVLPLPFFFRDAKIRKTLILTSIVFISLTLLVVNTTWGRGRYNQTSLFSSNSDIVQNDLQVQIAGEGHASAFVARLVHNKAIGFGQLFLDHYAAYFSPDFLFIHGGLPNRYQIPHVGLLFYTFLVLLLVLITFPRVKPDRSYFLYFLYLLFISVIPAALTSDDIPNLHRAVFMIVPLLFFLSLSVDNLLLLAASGKKVWTVIAVGLGLFFLVETSYSSHQYFALAGKINSFYRSDGNLQMARWLLVNKNAYPHVIAPDINWLPVYYLFVTNDFSKSYIGKFGEKLHFAKIGTIEFTVDSCPPLRVLNTYPDVTNSLLAVDGNCDIKNDYPNYTVVGGIKRIDATDAFIFLRKNKDKNQ